MALAERLETEDPILLDLTGHEFGGSSLLFWRDEPTVNSVSKLLTGLRATPYLHGDVIRSPETYPCIEILAVPLSGSRYNFEDAEDFLLRLEVSGRDYGAKARVAQDSCPLRFRASYKPFMGLFRRTPIFVERMPLDHFRQYAETRKILTPLQFILDTQFVIHDLAESP